MKYRELSDANFKFELERTKTAYEQALQVARRAAPTLAVMQARWDKVNAWHACLNAVEVEERRRAEEGLVPNAFESWLDQEIGI